MSRAIFDYESFPGPAGTDITAIAPTASDSPAPHWTVTGGSLKADGSGNLAIPGAANAKGLMPSPASGQFDAEIDVAAMNGATNVGFYLEQDAATYYAALEQNGSNATLVLKKSGGNGATDMPAVGTPIPAGVTAPFTLVVQKRIANGKATLTPVLNGTAYPAATDASPNLASVPSAASILVTQGSATVSRFVVTDPAGTAPTPPPAPTTVTLAGPSPASGTAGSESAPFTATLDQPAGSGGVVVNLASSAPGDAFRATAGGAAVTTVTIPAGATSATFLLVPAAAGTSSVSVTAAGLAVAGSPVACAVAAAQPTGTEIALLGQIQATLGTLLAQQDVILQATQTIQALPAPYTPAENASFWAARDAADVTAAEGQFVDFMAARPSLIAMIDARIALAVNGATSGGPVEGSLAANVEAVATGAGGGGGLNLPAGVVASTGTITASTIPTTGTNPNGLANFGRGQPLLFQSGRLAGLYQTITGSSFTPATTSTPAITTYFVTSFPAAPAAGDSLII